jgi:hypothetical protein
LNIEKQIDRVEIYNSLGIKVRNYDTTSKEIDISNFNIGAYFIKAYGKTATYLGRFVKI